MIEAELRAFYEGYIEAWNARAFDHVADCYAQPSVFVQPTGHVAMPDRAAILGLLHKVFDGLEAAGFSHSEVGAVDARPCGENMAMIDATDVRRLRKDGGLIETIDPHYVLTRSDDAWRIVTTVSCATGWRG